MGKLPLIAAVAKRCRDLASITARWLGPRSWAR
jgi:hypothetical protein